MKYARLRGTQDIVPPQIETWRAVERVFECVFERYGFEWIRTPIIEPTDLFVRAVGEQSDIVSKEMYTFTDRGERSVTLRPENTASVIRAYLENGLHRRGGLQRLCYAGPMFRYDRPQAGRYRQFHQVGAEAIGSIDPAVDVEMIQLVFEALSRLGFERLDLRVNSVGTERSRGPYRELLRKAIADGGGDIDPSIVARYSGNPLRVFDAKDVGDDFKARLPLISDHLDAQDADHFNHVRSLLGEVGVPFVHDERLVRGLDYYTNTVFEVYAGGTGAQSALCGGGRYDSLVEECGGAPTPAMGFSAGLERIITALPEGSPARTAAVSAAFYVVCDGGDASGNALRVASVLRKFGGARCDLSGRSRKKQIAASQKSGARVAVVVSSSDVLEVHDYEERTRSEVTQRQLEGWLREREARRKEAK